MADRIDGNAIRTQRTRARILAESLRLFNEEGEGRVTTGMIADALGISPGNLYYHFRNKDQIVEQLFARFEERIDVAPPLQATEHWLGRPAEAIEDLWLYLHLMFEEIHAYRFLYRNLDDLVGRSRKLRDRFNRIARRKRDAIVTLCEGLVSAGSMRATPAEIRALAQNVLVVSTYWLNYRALDVRRSRSSPGDDDAREVGEGAYQVMALVAPYLAPEARRHLDRLGRRYIE